MMRNLAWAVIGSNITMIPFALLFGMKPLAIVLLIIALANLTIRMSLERKEKGNVQK